MIGIVIVTHSRLGNELIDAAEFVIGERIEAVASVSTKGNPDKLRGKIARSIKEVGVREGVLILTDMFGGSASDMSYSFLEDGRVDVITAVNLPILLKAVDSRRQMDLPTLSRCLEAYGRRSISSANGILKGIRRSVASQCPFGEKCAA